MVYLAGIFTLLLYAVHIPLKFAFRLRLEDFQTAFGVSVFENRFALRAAKPRHARTHAHMPRISVLPLLRGIRLDISGKIALDSAMNTALLCGGGAALCAAVGSGLGMRVHARLTPDFRSESVHGEIRCIATAAAGHIILAVCIGILQSIGGQTHGRLSH